MINLFIQIYTFCINIYTFCISYFFYDKLNHNFIIKTYTFIRKYLYFLYKLAHFRKIGREGDFLPHLKLKQNISAKSQFLI